MTESNDAVYCLSTAIGKWLSLLSATSSPNDTIVWFLLLGLRLSPVMVGATDVIVGNAVLAENLNCAV